MKNQEAIHALADLAANTPEEKASVFFSISPHCKILSLAIHPYGWRANVQAPWNINTWDWSKAEELLRVATEFLDSIELKPEKKKPQIISEAEQLRKRASELEKLAEV